MDGRHDEPLLVDDLPRFGRGLQRRRVERRLRHRRLLRHLLGCDHGRPEGRDLDSPRRGQLLERLRLLERQRGLEHRGPLGRELVVRVRDERLPRRRELHDPREGDRQRGQRRDSGEPLLHLRHGRPERALLLPRERRRLHGRGVEHGLRHGRLLRHVLRPDFRSPGRRDLHPARKRQLLERHLLRKCLRGLPDGVALGRQLVVRVLGVGLPGGRLLHRPRARDRQRVEHGVGPEPDFPDRQRGPERALLLPGLGRRLLELRLERGLRDERLLRHVLRRDLRRPGRRHLHPARRHRPLLERQRLLVRLRGLPGGELLRRQLVVRLPRVGLPGRRELHRSYPRARQRRQHGDRPEPQLHDRQRRPVDDCRLGPVRPVRFGRRDVRLLGDRRWIDLRMRARRRRLLRLLEPQELHEPL